MIFLNFSSSRRFIRLKNEGGDDIGSLFEKVDKEQLFLHFLNEY